MKVKKIVSIGLLGYISYDLYKRWKKGKGDPLESQIPDALKTESKDKDVSKVRNADVSKGCGFISFAGGLNPIIRAKSDINFKNMVKNLQNYANLMLSYKGLKSQMIKIDGFYGACTDKALKTAFPNYWFTPKTDKEIITRYNDVNRAFMNNPNNIKKVATILG